MDNDSISELEKDICEGLIYATNDIHAFHFIFKRSEDWWLRRCCEKHECFLIDACIPVLIDSANRNANDANKIFDIAKTLGRLMTILKDASQSLSESMEALLLDFIYKFWDYIIEIVCHECVHIFDMLIRLHGLRCNRNGSGDGDNADDHCAWISHVLDLLMDPSVSCRSRFKCLLIFMKQYPSLIKQLTDEVICSLYESISNASLAVAASDLIAYDLSRWLIDSKRCTLHIKLLKGVLCSSNQQLRTGAKERLIPILFKDSQLARWLIEGFAVHLSDNGWNDTTLDAVLSLSHFCIFHQRAFSNYYYKWEDFIDESHLIRALLHSKSLIRLSAWNLLSDNPKLTLPIRKREIELMKAFLLTNISEQCPATRQKILVGLKKIFIRIREATQALMKTCSDDDLVRCYADFIVWLRDVCFESLENGANFNRRIMALHMIDCIFKQPFLWVENKDLFFQSIISRLHLQKCHHLRLLYCLDDSYQLCQALALDLLTSNCCDNEIDLDAFLEESKSRMLSIRSQNVMSTGYRIRYFLCKNPSKAGSLFEYLIDLCESRTNLVTENILNIAIGNGSLHPILNAVAISMEYIIWENLSATESQWWHSYVCRRLLPLCLQIGELVAPVVHSLSPEGFAPNALLNSNDDDYVELTSLTETSQLLLVGCWRAHRHISTILHLIASKMPYPELISPIELRRIGEYYWLQLTECKHCGAFELAVEGFEGLCSRLWTLGKAYEEGSDGWILPIPDKWLDDILGAIRGGVDVDKLCSTRRSAGLPYLVCAILGTEPKSRNSHCLRKALDSLLSFEHLRPQLQVHSINVLRSIFGDKRFSEAVLSSLERALRACLLGIASSHWPVRNAVSQLFAVLLVRIFGVTRTAQRTLKVHQKNKMSAYEFFSRFPSLYGLLYSQLSTFGDVSNEFRVFPILILLTHLFPSIQRAREYPIAVFIWPIVRILFGCKNAKLRELAAYAIVTICEEQDAALLLKWIRALELKNLGQNQIHSVLLMMQMLNERFENVQLRNDVRTTVEVIVERRLFCSWCDCNTAVFTSFMYDCGIRPTLLDIRLLITNSANVWLTIRPLAALLAKLLTEKSLNHITERMTEVIGLLRSDRRLRSELWRAFVKLSLQRGDINIDLLRLAANDLCDSDHYTVENILRLLLDNVTMVLQDEECLIVINGFVEQLTVGIFSLRVGICEDLAHLLAMELRLMNVDLRWILNCVQRGSAESKRIALRGLLAAREYGFNVEELLKIGTSLLQNEEVAIREESASILSSFLEAGNIGGPLNAQIVLWMILKRFPSVGEAVFGDTVIQETDDSRLFDACVTNPYLEARPFGIEHFSVLETIGLKTT